MLCYPLGPKPWALANGDGTMKQTDKAQLGRHIEKRAANVDSTSGARATIVDAMGIVQKMHGENQTFEEVSHQLLQQVLYNGAGSARVDVVFDLYQDDSIQKCRTCQSGFRRGCRFQPDQARSRNKNWKRLLASIESKNRLTKYLADSWKEEKYREKLGNTTLIVMSYEPHTRRPTPRLWSMQGMQPPNTQRLL